ncbi:MAG: FHA domain-containing protein, partial [Ktedonobacteraceae bacterium]
PQATPRQGLPASNKGTVLTTEMARVPQDTPLDAEAPDNEEKQKPQRLPSINTLVPEGAKVYAYLDFERAGEETQHLAITRSYSIVGRLDPKRGITPEIDLTQLDTQATVSRQHARIRFERTFFYIEDLKSHNKTRLGQLVLTPLKPELIQHGDEVWFGSLKMIFRVPGQPNMPLPKNLP